MDLEGEALRFGAGGLGEVVALARVDDAARRVDDHAAAPRVAPRPHGEPHVAALGADTGDEDRHVAHDGAHGREFGRVGGAHHDGAVVLAVPVIGDAPRHGAVQRLAGDVEVLELAAAGVRGADERVGGADVAALGVVDHRHVGCCGPDVAQDGTERRQAGRPEAFEEGRVGLERAGEVRRGIDDGGAEPQHRPRLGVVGRVLPRGGAQALRQALPVGVEPDRDEEARVPARVEQGAEVASAHARTRHFSVSPAHIGTIVSPMPVASTSAGTTQGSSTRVTLSALRS